MSEQTSVAEAVSQATATETTGPADPGAPPQQDPQGGADPASERAAAEERVKASRLAALARRERSLAEAEKASKAAAAEAEAKAKAAEERLARIEAEAKRVADLEQKIANARRNPMAALQALGLSYKDVTESVLQDGKPSPELLAADFDARLQKELESRMKPLQERLDAYEEQRRKAEEAQEKAQTDAQHAQAIATLDRNARAYLEANAERYEAIAAFEAEGEVARLIELEWDRSWGSGKPVLLSYEQAAQRIEAFLQDQYGISGEDEKAARRRAFFQKRLAPPAPAAPTPAPASRPKPGTKTITNAAASAATPPPPPAATREDALERALKVMQQAKAKKAG